MACLGCICHICANNINSMRSNADEQDFACFNCDECSYYSDYGSVILNVILNVIPGENIGYNNKLKCNKFKICDCFIQNKRKQFNVIDGKR